MLSSLFTLLTLVGIALSVPLTGTGVDVDNDAIFTFGAMGAQRRNLDTTAISEMALNGLDSLSYLEQVFLLEAGGLSPETIQFALDVLLPKLKLIGRDAKEQSMALLMLANKFCYVTKEGANECDGNESEYLALTTFKTDLGCKKSDVLSFGIDAVTRTFNTSSLSEEDFCRCADQTDPLLWMNIMSQFSGRSAIQRRAQTIAVLVDLFEQKCEGVLASNELIQCTCNRTTEGHDAFFLQTIMSDDDLLEKVTEQDSVQEYMQEKLKQGPTTRISKDALLRFMLQSMGGNMDPMMLNFMLRDKNSGVSSSEYMKQMMLSQMGLDASLAHLMLSGGLNGGDKNKIAMVNYMSASGAIDPAMVPMMLNVPNGKSFFMSSMIESGAMDPVVGLMMLGRESGVKNDELMEIVMESASNPDKASYLQSIYAPYVPGLPAGIYPGSELFFAHFELLGVNTCALHDLRNRFECGYVGISASECETAPYCCYSPLYLDDTRVRKVTDGAIQSASAVPWCYYNVFFVLFDSYSMKVKIAGEFASPITCKGLFKFGLNIAPTMYTLLAAMDKNPLAKYMVAVSWNCFK